MPVKPKSKATTNDLVQLKSDLFQLLTEVTCAIELSKLVSVQDFEVTNLAGAKRGAAAIRGYIKSARSSIIETQSQQSLGEIKTKLTEALKVIGNK